MHVSLFRDGLHPNPLALPLLLLSGITLPMTLGPLILQHIANFNPFFHAVNAARALVNGQSGQSAIMLSFALFIVLTALSFWWAARSMRNAMM